MIIDNHVHVGWYSDRYHAPQEVWNFTLAAGVNDMAVSSTSTCAELYKVVVQEMRELIRIGGDRIHPILWLTPRMMKTWGIRYMLKSKIKWQGVKMHWFAHHEWHSNKKLLSQAIEVVRKLDVPLLLHTGEDDCCNAKLFEPLCLANPDLIFILAHGRPIEQTIQLLSHCPNTFVDTAFMPIADVLSLINTCMGSRIIFGSDAPINQLYNKDLSTSECVKRQINELRAKLSKNDFDAIMHRCPYKNN